MRLRSQNKMLNSPGSSHSRGREVDDHNELNAESNSDANPEAPVVDPRLKRTKSVQKIKEEYYDFFEPDSDPLVPIEEDAVPETITMLELHKPLGEVSNVTQRSKTAIAQQNTPKSKPGSSTLGGIRAQQVDDDDVVLLKRPPSQSVSPNKAKAQAVIDLAKEELKEEQERAFLNPKWKADLGKHDAPVGFQSVWRRVETLKILPFRLPNHLTEDFLNTTVTRAFLVHLFGGSSQATYPFQRQKNFKRPGYDNFMCLNLLWNPRAPQRAGFPGLFYESGIGNDGRTQRVFVRLQTNKWLYLGNYQMVKAEALTRQEWLENTDETKATWAEKTCTSAWGDEIRTRIALRKRLGRNATRMEVEAEPDAGKDVTPEEVMTAFDSGRERLQAWVMKCTSYEVALQREFVEGMKTWVPPERKPRKKKGDDDDDDENVPKKVGRKRKITAEGKEEAGRKKRAKKGN